MVWLALGSLLGFRYNAAEHPMSSKTATTGLPGEPQADALADVLDVPTVRGHRQKSADGPRLVPTLTIAAHPDTSRVGARLSLDALQAGMALELSRKQPNFALPGETLGAPLGDRFISRKPISIALSDSGGVRLHHLKGAGTDISVNMASGGRTGAGLDESANISRAAIVQGVPIALAGRVLLVLHLVDCDLPIDTPSFDMIGRSTSVQRVRNAIAHIRDLEMSVLIRGQTGTGKELVARATRTRAPPRWSVCQCQSGCDPTRSGCRRAVWRVQGCIHRRPE